MTPEQKQHELAAIRERHAKMPAGDYTKREQHDDWGLVRRPDGWPFADVCVSVDYGHEDVGKTAPDFVDAKREFVSHAVADIDILLTLLADAEQAADARQAEIADQLEERAAKLRHIGQTDKSNELVYVAVLLRGEFRGKGAGMPTNGECVEAGRQFVEQHGDEAWRLLCDAWGTNSDTADRKAIYLAGLAAGFIEALKLVRDND